MGNTLLAAKNKMQTLTTILHPSVLTQVESQCTVALWLVQLEEGHAKEIAKPNNIVIINKLVLSRTP